MRGLLWGCIGICVFGLAGLGLVRFSVADEPSPPGLQLETLLSAQLEGADGFEVIVSRVTMPPNTSLPKHWHPGEEFAYVLEGSSILRRDGLADVTVTKGEAIKIALKQVHTAVTTDEGATILVFRVHEHGQPERVLVE
jgi:quercetin dioxygenase-like cupin family protein